MSWSIPPIKVFGDSVDRELKDAQPNTYGEDPIPPHVAQQTGVAKAAAAKIIRSGAVGHPGQDFSVTLRGHANPEHKPAEGHVNDTITVLVTQV